MIDRDFKQCLMHITLKDVDQYFFEIPGIELLMTPGLVHRLIELLFTPSDCSETHPIIASYSLSFPGAAGDFLGLLPERHLGDA